MGFFAGAANGADDVGEARVSDIASWLVEHQSWVLTVLTILSVIIIWRFNAVRVGGLDAGERDVKPIPALMWLFAAATTFLAWGLGAQAAVEVLGFTGETIRDRAVQTLVSNAVAALVGLGLLWFVAREAKDAGVRPGWADWPIGIGLFFVIYPIVALAGLVGLWTTRGMDTVPQDRLAHETLQLIAQHQGDAWTWVLSAVVVLLVPLVEELIYRVYLQSAIVRLIRVRWLSVILTSLLFTAIHWPILPEGGRYAMAPIFVLSVGLGAAYERTGKLGVPIAMHASFNALNLLMAFLIEPMAQG
ncbi:MAG: CPBP family intramembrane metalloprotease [Phycisphaerales bacterium]|nr:CPBP family intramembrane metalloprotease [Phycisphaerales bacterium]